MKINRCPKCGGEPSSVIFGFVTFMGEPQEPGYEIECYDCGLHTGKCKTYDEAVTKWNELTNNLVTKK